MLPLRPPSLRLQAAIRALIDAWPVDDSLGNWPRRLMKERGVLLLHGNQAYLWYLAPEGTVYSLDTDRYGQPFDIETDAEAAVNAVAQAARLHPELTEMLPERPPEARDCPSCHGTGGEWHCWPACRCCGLGWIA